MLIQSKLTDMLIIQLIFCFQFSPTSPQPASLPAEDISTNTNGPKQEILLDDDQEDLFPGM